MAEKSKICNPLVAIIVFLVITIVLILGALVVMRLNVEKEETVRIVEKLVQHRHNVTEATTTTSTTMASTATSTSVVTSETPPTAPPRNVCESPICITLAHQMNNWRNPKVDPCDNFFEYTCGKYAEHTDSATSRIGEKSYIVQGLVREFLHKNKSTNSPSEKALHMFFKKCIELRNRDIYALESVRINEEIMEDIRRIGVWPAIDPNWDSKKFDLNEMLANIAATHVTSFGLFSVQIGPMKDFGVWFEKRRKTEKMPGKALFAAIRTILEAEHIPMNKRQLQKDINEFKEFETFLAKKARRMKGQSAEPLSNLTNAVPSIDFDRILRKKSNLNDAKWAKLREMVSVDANKIFFGPRKENLEAIVKTTDPRKMANFVMFHVFEFLYSVHALRTHRKECDELVHLFLPRAVFRVFMNNHFEAENMNATAEYVSRTQASYLEMFKENTWLTEETRAAAIKKLNMLESQIGHAQDLTQENVEKRFEKLNLSSSATLYSLINKVTRFRQEELLVFFANDTDFTVTDELLEANAYYVPEYNDFYFLVPIMDEPYFSKSIPDYAKLAAVGSIIAHEIGHGFDPNGINHDESGKEVNWWDDESRGQYLRRVECLVKLTDNYDDPAYGRTLIGRRLIGEIVSDVLSLAVNWRTLKKSDQTKEPRMIGFEEESIERVFFHLSALNFCEPFYKRRDSASLSHPPGNFRINGVYANSKEFAEAYQCPIGSPMNPAKKCDMF